MSTPSKPIRNTSKLRLQVSEGVILGVPPSNPPKAILYEVLHTGNLCKVVIFHEGEGVRFELQTLDGSVLGKYQFVTDALDELDAREAGGTDV